MRAGATRAGCRDNDEAVGLRWERTGEWIDGGMACTDGPRGDDVGLRGFGAIGHGKGVLRDLQTNLACARRCHG
jgi:hypothetical protein